MDTLLSILDRISFLAAMPAVAGLLVTLGMIFLSRSWQARVLGLAILYFALGLLYTLVIRPEVALIKALIGWLICLTFYVTGRYLDERQGREVEKPPRQGRHLPSLAPATPLRALVLLAAFVIAYSGSVHLSLPRVPGDVGLACYLLVVTGLFLAGISEDPLRVGMGLLLFISGFDLFFGSLEPSLVVAGLLGAAGFMLALAVTFMAVTRAAAEEERS